MENEMGLVFLLAAQTGAVTFLLLRKSVSRHEEGDLLKRGHELLQEEDKIFENSVAIGHVLLSLQPALARYSQCCFNVLNRTAESCGDLAQYYEIPPYVLAAKHRFREAA